MGKKKKECPYELAYQTAMDCLSKVELHRNDAVMFDIDDTLLFADGRQRRIVPIINLLYECIKKNLIIMIITARDDKYKNETVRELKRYKIPYDILHLRKNPHDNYFMFKSDIKKFYLMNENINVILSVGDNEMDVVGPYSGFYIKLPDR